MRPNSTSSFDAMRRLGPFALALALLAGCNPSTLSEEEKRTVASLSLAALPEVPDDLSNRYDTSRAAAAFGATLFFDTDLSANGEVACATCHKVDRQFQDDLPLARGIGTTDRRTMPLSGVAWSPWQFWDGRSDSLWAQALRPLEDAREHGADRTMLAHVIARKFADRYASIFGPLPELAGLPDHAGPRADAAGQAAWDAIDPAKRQEIDAVYANLGKAIAAFERSIVPTQTRFDRFAAALAKGEEPTGDAVFSDLETEGLKLFMGKAGCVNCHNGPRFTDDHFHNTGVPAVAGLPADRGRAQAIAQLDADTFNCLGQHSDAAGTCDELKFMLREGDELVRAFKTPSLRGVASRPPYMHSGQFATLDAVIDHYSHAPAAPEGKSEIGAIVFTDRGRAALIAFLKTLDP
jgi:cytochrome c peroxidase